jgi:hypothetical protein
MRAIAFVPILLLVAGVRAQDDVLAVERREDLRAHEGAVRLLKSARATFHLEATTPRELCRLLATATGDKLSFTCPVKDEDAGAPIALDLKNASLWSAMAVAQMQTELRFVFRAGVVFLLPKDRIKPLTYLAIYDLRPQCAPLRNFPGPRLGLRGLEESEGPEEEAESTTTVSGFTADAIENLIKEQVTPEQWGSEGVSLTNDSGLFVVRHTLRGHRELRELLDALGLVPLPRTIQVPGPPPRRPRR